MTPGHPPFDRLVDLVKGDLSAEQRTEIAAHVTACSHCAADVAWLEQLLDLYHTQDSVSAPASAIAGVISLFRPKLMSQSAEQLRRILAVLTFDSASMPLVMGMRSEKGTRRQLVFRAEEFDLDVHVVSSGSRWIISGQVLGSNEAGQAELQDHDSVLQVSLNDLSQFTLPPVASGTYTLIVRLNNAVMEVARLEVGS